MRPKTVLLLSGGMDSTTLLYFLRMKNHEVHALSFNYGQRHSRELEAAKKICEITSTPHQIVDITSITDLISCSSLTGDEPVPKGHYEDETMKKTVVPNRNMILLSLATGYAVNIGAENVAYAAHAGDHAIYPDCRPEFFEKINEVTKISNYQPVEIYAPFLHISKGDIAEIGRDLNVPYEVTWTCYEGGEEPCGECGACVERKEAMEQAGLDNV